MSPLKSTDPGEPLSTATAVACPVAATAREQTLPVLCLDKHRSPVPAVRRRFLEQFRGSLEEWGFLVLDGHGLSEPRFLEAFEQCQEFFSLDEPLKRDCESPESLGNRGYVGLGGERAVGASVGDLKEFFHVGQPNRSAGDPGRDACHGANVWPEECAVPGFRRTMLGLYADLESLAGRVLAACEDALGIESGLLQSWIRGGNSILRLIHYPPLPDSPGAAVRAAAHEDINLVTLLCEGTSGGLEIRRPDGSWMPVRSLSGQLVLNVGDMLSRATNGRLRSTTHRVVNPDHGTAGVSRYSLPFFVHPRPEVRLDVGGRSGVGPTAGEFLRMRLEAISARGQ